MLLVLLFVVLVLGGACIVLLRINAELAAPASVPLPSLVEQRMRENLIVTLKSGAAFAGVLWEVDEKVWVLRDAVAIGADSTQPNVGVDGEVILPADNVEYAQRA